MLKIVNLKIETSSFKLGPISLNIEKGEFFVVLGPTGAGKTLFLEAIAGVTSGRVSGKILLNDKDISKLPPQKRSIGIVYQDVLLFPHMNVRKNIDYGLRFCKLTRKERTDRIKSYSSVLGIEHLLDRMPEGLSGGEKQRIALARGLAPGPSVMLLDEPLSAVDTSSRDELRKVLKKLNHQFNSTFIMVTHDIEEALFLAHRIAILNIGKIETIKTPRALLHDPGSVFVAQFLRFENIIPAHISGERAILPSGLEFQLGCDEGHRDGFIVVRPDEIIVSQKKFKSSARNSIPCMVKEISDQGTFIKLNAASKGTDFKVVLTRASKEDLELLPGKEIYITFKASSIKVL